MLKYIVTWIIVKMYIGPCPLPPAQYDQYGRDTTDYSPHLGQCISIDTIPMSRSFLDRDSAFSFLKQGRRDAKKEAAVRDGKFIDAGEDFGKILRFKIDSVQLKKTK